MVEISSVPTPEEIRAARTDAGLTMKEAAQIVGSNSHRTWQAYESSQNKMPLAKWELFLIKIGKKRA